MRGLYTGILHDYFQARYQDLKTNIEVSKWFRTSNTFAYLLFFLDLHKLRSFG